MLLLVKTIMRWGAQREIGAQKEMERHGRKSWALIRERVTVQIGQSEIERHSEKMERHGQELKGAVTKQRPCR